MKKHLLIAAAVTLFSSATFLNAIPVTGTIQITGDVQFDTMSLLTATVATFPGSDGVVTSGTIDYGVPGVAGSAVTFANFTFAATGPNAVTPLWSFVNAMNGWTYTFNLSSITAITRLTPVPGTDFLSIAGLGTVNITGAGSPYEVTHANWSFNVTDTSGGQNSTFTFAFNDSNTATDRVPEGGATVALLGLSLLGLGALRRKLA